MNLSEEVKKIETKETASIVRGGDVCSSIKERIFSALRIGKENHTVLSMMILYYTQVYIAYIIQHMQL